MKKVKLFWDFRGPSSKFTADHHLIHLKEFLEKENLEAIETGIIESSELFNSAYIVIVQNDLEFIKNALKPHRGVLID